MTFKNVKKKFPIIKALLHKVNISCGRTLVYLLFGAFVMSCASMTDDGANPMESYYLESRGLSQSSIDSTLNFVHKYNRYVFNTPGSRNDVHYHPTMSNICAALDTFGYKLVGWNLDVTITVNNDL